MSNRSWAPACLSATLAAAAVAASSSATAAEPIRRDTLTLSASASTEVTRDLLAVAFSTTREGTDAATVQTALKQALDAALNEAKKAAKPGQVEVQTGNFALYPRYSNKGGITGWQGSAELLVEGKDAPAIAQLTGRISSMSIARVGYSLSREQRERAEAEVSAQAIARYRARATEYAKQFGYANYSIGEVSVSGDEPMRYMAAGAPRMKTMGMVADEALPVEAGKATVTVTVSGSVLMSAK
jgi:predicted secreted protein